MDIKDLNQITQYFVQYGKDEQLGHKFFHKENDNFKIIITPDKELYQLNTDHEPYGIELDTIDNLKIRFKSFTGENLEDVSRTYNQIIDEANTNYLRNCLDTKWMKEDFYFDGSPRHHLYLREEFINKSLTELLESSSALIQAKMNSETNQSKEQSDVVEAEFKDATKPE